MGQIASLFGIALKAIYGVIGNYGLSIIEIGRAHV